MGLQEFEVTFKHSGNKSVLHETVMARSFAYVESILSMRYKDVEIICFALIDNDD
mgnify:CR=1 FL=1|jgi:hypothetical protein